MKKTIIRVASKNVSLASLTLLLVLAGVSSGQTTEPATQPALTLEQQISALDSILNNRVNPPAPDDRVKLAMQETSPQATIGSRGGCQTCHRKADKT